MPTHPIRKMSEKRRDQHVRQGERGDRQSGQSRSDAILDRYLRQKRRDYEKIGADNEHRQPAYEQARHMASNGEVHSVTSSCELSLTIGLVEGAVERESVGVHPRPKKARAASRGRDSPSASSPTTQNRTQGRIPSRSLNRRLPYCGGAFPINCWPGWTGAPLFGQSSVFA